MSNKTKPLSFELEDLTKRIEKSKKLKIACFSIPNFGHMFPMSHVAIALKDATEDLNIYTEIFLRKIGSKYIKSIDMRESWAFVGVVG